MKNTENDMTNRNITNDGRSLNVLIKASREDKPERPMMLIGLSNETQFAL